jgi:hypothetical protein
MKQLIALLIALSILAGCKPPSTDSTNNDSFPYGISRHVDEEAGVVCWVYTSYQRGGIDCLPISDTKLGE